MEAASSSCGRARSGRAAGHGSPERGWFIVKLLAVSWGCEVSTTALRRAATLSKEPGAELHVAHIWTLPLPYVPEFMESTHCARQEEEARRLMETAVETVEAAGGTVAGTHIGSGFPESEVIRLSEELGAETVIAGKQRRGVLKRLFVGCAAERIARYAPCPVVLVEQESPLASPV